MKMIKIVNIFLLIAIVGMGIKIYHLETAESGEKESEADSEAAVLDNITTRTSIRTYQNKKIDPEDITRLLKAGMAAPTAMNLQPWHFIVVTDSAKLNQLGGINTRSKGAPLTIIVCGDITKERDGEGKDFWIQDCSAATENILLAAHAMGLGAVWTGGYPLKDRYQAMQKLFKLPETLIPLSAVVIGYGAETPAPKDKWKEENISYNSYQDKAVK